MEKRSVFHVKKRTLLAVAGCVWLIAGFNVARLGLIAYGGLPQVRVLHLVLSAAVFCAFGLMFFKMSIKHTRRIKGYREEFRPVWNFFDLKAYIIMAVMMGGGSGSVRPDWRRRCSSPCFTPAWAAPLPLRACCFGPCL